MSQKRPKGQQKQPKGKRKRPKGKRKAPPKKLSIGEEDTRREAAILRDVIELHPAHLVEEELIRRRGVDPKDAAFQEIDAWRQAIRVLRDDGLLQPCEPVNPTIAALRFAELMEL